MPRNRCLSRTQIAAAVTTLLMTGTALVACGDEALTADSTCREFLNRPGSERSDTAIRMSSQIDGVSNPGNPMWALSLDAKCGADPSMALRAAFGGGADRADSGRAAAPQANSQETAKADVGRVLQRYARATADKDLQTICDDVYAKDLLERVRAAGLPCEVALSAGLKDRQNPRLEVLGVEVKGEQALARVRSTAGGEPTSTDLVRLVKEDGGWRIASLSEPGATLQSPQP